MKGIIITLTILMLILFVSNEQENSSTANIFLRMKRTNGRNCCGLPPSRKMNCCNRGARYNRHSGDPCCVGYFTESPL